MASAKHMQLERDDTEKSIKEKRGRKEGALYCIGSMTVHGRKKLM